MHTNPNVLRLIRASYVVASKLYNPLQEFAYLSTLSLEDVSMVTGFALLQPVCWLDAAHFLPW